MTTTTYTHPIDARANLSLFAAILLILGIGVVAVAAHVQPPPTDGITTETVAEFGD